MAAARPRPPRAAPAPRQGVEREREAVQAWRHPLAGRADGVPARAIQRSYGIHDTPLGPGWY